MSDSDESGVTYTDISSPFEELSDIGSPRAYDHEHLKLPEMLEDPYVESPEYVPESDFEAHPEDDDDEDPEEDPVDYPADGGDDDDDDEELSEDDEDDEMDIEADEEEEEEHPALVDSIVVASTAADQAPSAKEMELFETDESAATPPPHPAYRTTVRISIPAPRLDIPLSPRYEVGESSSVAAARPVGGFRADYGFVATVNREIMCDPEREVSYGITDSWDEIVETLQGAPVCTDTELGGYVREFETRVRQDTDEIYIRLDDEQTERQLLAGRLNMLFRDRHAHAYTRHLMETEARMSREAWVRVTDASDLVHGEVMSLRTIVREITELRTALQGQVTALQGQVTALEAQVTILQGPQGLAGGPTQPELPEEARGSA
nr:hypothetical protein [Tanacetum cinerariifolium]